MQPVFRGGCGRDECLAVDETIIFLHHPSTFSRCFNSDGERERQQNDSLVNGYERRAATLMGPFRLSEPGPQLDLDLDALAVRRLEMLSLHHY